MSKVKPHLIDPSEKFQAIDSLFEVISKLKTKQEIVDFFLGLFTSSESLMMARRIQIARMLLDEKSYEDIMKKLRVSSQTINSTDKWLHRGDEKYTAWLKNRVSVVESKNNSKKNPTYESLLDKYPYHRFIKNLFD